MSSPKYQAICADLKAQIQSESIPAGSYLPSESDLMKQYEASRDTIRKALAQLSASGYIQKEKGKGSLVLHTDPISFPVSGLTSFKELQHASMHSDVSTELVDFKTIAAGEKLKKKTGMDAESMVEIKRVRVIDGERIIYDHDFINPALIPGLQPEHAANSIYEYIEQELGRKVSFARKEITVIPASREDRRLLDLGGYDLVVCVRSYNFLDDASLFCYTESRHRPDKFRFVDFSRREAQPAV